MPHNLDLIFTLTGGFTAALVFGYLTQRIRLSPIVGYLLAILKVAALVGFTLVVGRRMIPALLGLVARTRSRELFTPDAVIREAKEINPHLLILSRASYVREIAALKEAGANMVVSSEGEVAFAMAERLLQQLGATGEQLDRARDRIRAELPAA